MGNCCLCGKKMGRFEGGPIAPFKPNMSSYNICGSCSPKIRSLEQGNVEFVQEFQNLISKIEDNQLKEYLIDICREPYEKEKDRINADKEKREREEFIREKKLMFKKLMDKNENPILLTTGYNFEGYRIVQYKSIISGEYVLGTGFISELGAFTADLLGRKSGIFSDKLKEAKNEALLNLQELCYINGGNGIIGVDFDYITFENNMMGVVANGTAVVIEKVN